MKGSFVDESHRRRLIVGLMALITGHFRYGVALGPLAAVTADAFGRGCRYHSGAGKLAVDMVIEHLGSPCGYIPA